MCILVIWIGKYDFIYYLSNLMVVFLVKVCFGFLKNCIGIVYVFNKFFSCFFGWQFIKGCWIVIELIEIQYICCFYVMVDGVVIVVVGSGFCQVIWQFEVGCYFVVSQIFIGYMQSLVIDIMIQVLLVFQQINNIFVISGWLVVLGYNNFSFVILMYYSFVDIF